MSTDVDAPPRRRHHYRWLALLVVLATIALVGLLRVVATGSPSPAQQEDPQARREEQPAQALPDALRTQLAARLVAALEQATPAEQHNHGHGAAAAGGGKLVCAADVFGVDPPTATAVAQVGTAYALHLCAVAEPGRTWETSAKYSGPLAANLGDPPVLYIVQPGAGYPERVRQLIPARYQERAKGPFLDEQALAELRRRFDAAKR